MRAENVSFVSCIARNCIIEVYNQQKRSSFEKEDVRWWVYEEHERTVLAMRIFFAGHVFCQTGSDDDHITGHGGHFFHREIDYITQRSMS